MLTKKICALLCAALVPLLAEAQKDTLRLLSVANSFGEDATEQNLHEIALADGHVLIIGNLYIGGCTLEKHWNNAKSNKAAYSYRKIGADGVKVTTPKTRMAAAFADEPWDIVVFHQASALSGKIESYEPFLGNLISYTLKHTHARCKIYLNQTWAYAKDATHPAFGTYGRNQKTMYDSLSVAYKTMAEKYHLPLIPTGTAVQNARATYFREDLTRDGYHLSWWRGRYLAAATYYAAIYGTSVKDNTFRPPHMDEDETATCKACADAAVAAPFKLTKGLGADIKRVDNFNPKAMAPYTLPDALTMQDGTPVTTPEQWYDRRRPELLELFTTEMFGRAPGKPEMTFETVEQGAPALDGKAIRHEVRIHLPVRHRVINLLVYTPADAQGPVPVFLGVNFKGNTAVCDDPGIHEVPQDERRAYGIFPILDRGATASRCPVREIVARGYGVATYHCSDIDPDYEDGRRNGVVSLIYKDGQDYPEPDQWGTIAQWAWGLSRCLDYLETYDRVDASKAVVLGHSRMGKTALWAGVSDPRFAIVISNDSGCSGAALSRRKMGETLYAINSHFPHWFCDNYKKYNLHEENLPFDQHELLALVAPRPVYVASSEQDGWADYIGERLALQEASKIYHFLGLGPEYTGYHIKEGPHSITIVDWNHYMDFADMHFFGK